MAMQKLTIGTVLSIAVMGMVLTGLGALVATRTFSNTGNLRAVGVGVYWNSGCTSVVSSVDWGALEPGKTKDSTVYVKNEGTVSLVLNIRTDSWNPASASSYVTLSWNRENYVLAAGSVVQAVLTLSVSSSASGVTSFSFNIIISGTESA